MEWISHKVDTFLAAVVIAVAAIAGVMGFFLIKSYLPPPHLGTLGAKQS